MEAWTKASRYYVFTIILLVLTALIWYARAIISPLVIAALIAYILNPMVVWLTRRTHLSRSLVVSIVYFVGLALIIGLPALLLPQLSNEILALAEDLQIISENSQRILSRPLNIVGFQLDLEAVTPDFGVLITEVLSGNILEFIESTSKNFAWVLVTLVSIYYLLKDWSKLRDWLLRLPPERYQADVQRLYEEIAAVWRGYLRGNLLLMLIVGVVFTIAWIAIGIPGALILGVITGVLTIIPDLGPAIAAAIAIGVALVEGSTFLPMTNFWFGVLVLGVYLVLINVKNLWLRPRIFGRSVHMHEGVVFIVIMAAVVFQGILGALIVVPVLVSAAVVMRYLYRSAMKMPPWPEEASSPGAVEK